MKSLFLLFTMILMPITSFSQTISTQIVTDSIPVSTSDIKYSNLIFVEHENLILENKLLDYQLGNYETLTNNLEETINFQKQEINNYKGLNNLYTDKIQVLDKEVKKKNSHLLGWKIGGITVAVGLLITLIFK